MSQKMKTIDIERTKETDTQTTGKLKLKDMNGKVIFECYSLELPWKDNKRNESRIPEGSYFAAKHNSPKFGKTIWLQNIPDRTEILIHKGNFNRDTKGCILVGTDLVDIDGDGNKDVTNSSRTLEKLLNLIEKDILIVHITNFF